MPNGSNFPRGNNVRSGTDCASKVKLCCIPVSGLRGEFQTYLKGRVLSRLLMRSEKGLESDTH